MKTRDWYFQGWERDADGKFRYTGEYYTLPGGKPKVMTISLSAVLIVLFLLTALLPSEGGMWHIAAIPQLLELIPLLYLIIGAVYLALLKQPMTFRGWYSSWRRMKTASVWSIVFCAAMVLAEIAYFFIGEDISAGRELSYFIRSAGCTAVSAVLFRYMSSHPCSQTIKKE